MHRNQFMKHTSFFQKIFFSLIKKVINYLENCRCWNFRAHLKKFRRWITPPRGILSLFFLFLQKQLNSILSVSQSRLAKNKPSAIHLCGGAGFFKLGQPKNSIFIGGTSLLARTLCWLSSTLFVMIFNHFEKWGDSTIIESCEKNEENLQLWSGLFVEPRILSSSILLILHIHE